MVINARAAVRDEVTGVERWAKEMVTRLPRLRPNGYAVVAPPRALAHRAGHAWEQVALPVGAALRRASLVYSPANLAPLGWPRNVVLMHDAAPFRNPDWYSPAYVSWQRAVVTRVARRALLVITVSEFARQELVDLLAVPPERVVIVPGGVDARFRPNPDGEEELAKLGLRRPYVLSVASVSPRKNLTALEETARRVAELGYELVVAGAARAHLREGEARLDTMRLLGHVPEPSLPALYAGAAAFVLPSRYEGFGLVCLEAMAAGVPVVASTAPALAETCGDAAILVDPDDQRGFADAVVRLLDDSDEARSLRERGLERAADFSWDRAARETDAVLREQAQRVLE